MLEVSEKHKYVLGKCYSLFTYKSSNNDASYIKQCTYLKHNSILVLKTCQFHQILLMSNCMHMEDANIL